jgi:hypothetical protein
VRFDKVSKCIRKILRSPDSSLAASRDGGRQGVYAARQHLDFPPLDAKRRSYSIANAPVLKAVGCVRSVREHVSDQSAARRTRLTPARRWSNVLSHRNISRPMWLYWRAASGAILQPCCRQS